MATTFMYDKVRQILAGTPEERTAEDVAIVEPWFRKKSKLFEGLKSDVLRDLIKHCDFTTVKKDAVIIHQGERGNAFFIIVSGKVSIYIIEAFEDMVLGSNDRRETDRSKLGTNIASFSDGKTFGELALINDDCVRSASVIADVQSDIIVIHRDLYNRSVSKIVNQDFEEKLNFINQSQLFKLWPQKWKKHLAVALLSDTRNHSDVLVKQGDSSNYIYFILNGEVKLVCDPDRQRDQFGEFMQKCAREFDIEDEKIGIQTEYFSLANWVSAKSRTAERLRSAPGSKSGGTNGDDGKVLSADLPEFKLIKTPSSIRKANSNKNAKERVNICYLEAGNTVGDVEFLLNLQVYHATAICTQATSFIYIHRAIFDRLFRKKNPHTLTIMGKTMGAQFLKRSSRTKLNLEVPLLKYITCKIQELNGERKAMRGVKDEDGHYLPQVDTQSTRTVKSRNGFRVKSGYSSRSYPLAKKSRKMPEGVFRSPTAYGGQGQGAGFNSSGFGQVNSDTENDLPQIGYESGYESSTTPYGFAAEYTVNLPNHSPAPGNAQANGAVTMVEETSATSTPENPREGIFMKLMQVANPMLDRRYLDMEEDEYQYMLQLRRRLAKQLQDFYPYAKPSTDKRGSRKGNKGAGSRGKTAVGRSLPTIQGLPDSPRKTAMKSNRDKAGASKSVLFSLPKF